VYDPIELIVPDNFSTDATAEISEKCGARVLSAELGMSAARNFGVAQSRGEYVLCLDSDFELSAGLVSECVELCEAGFDAVSINQEFVGVGFWATCRKLENRTYWGDVIIESPRFFARRIFDEVGGYDDRLTAGEDYDFAIRLIHRGCRIGFARSLIYHHESGSLRFIVMKKYRYGKSMGKFLSKHGGVGRSKFYPVRSQWITHRNLLVEKPAVLIGLPFLKFLQYYCALIGSLVGEHES
jgi:glycosyltransferase involved in cell wall biosynthesis